MVSQVLTYIHVRNEALIRGTRVLIVGTEALTGGTGVLIGGTEALTDWGD